jgi:hypothetical protein
VNGSLWRHTAAYLKANFTIMLGKIKFCNQTYEGCNHSMKVWPHLTIILADYEDISFPKHGRFYTKNVAYNAVSC